MTGTWIRRAIGATTAAVGAACVAVVAAAPAGAGGGEWMYPVQDRYEAGQDVVMVGYTTTARPEPATGGRYYAWLRVDPGADVRGAQATGTYVDPTDIRVAPVVVEEPAADPFLGRRASISFTLPAELAPGEYHLVLCNDPCTEAPGYLVPELLHVGVQPDYEVVRDWPATERAMRWLAADALVYAPGGQPVAAADLRAGRYPPPPPAAPVAEAPAVAEAPPTTAPPAPRVAGAARSRMDGAAPAAAPPSAGEPTSREPAPEGGGRDRGWAPLGAWLAVLGALAAASAALVARGRRRTARGSGPAGAPGTGAHLGPDSVLCADPAPVGRDPHEEGAGRPESPLVRT